jgi:hypothetical protein
MKLTIDTKRPIPKITGHLQCHIFLEMVREGGKEMCPCAHLEVPLIEPEVNKKRLGIYSGIPLLNKTQREAYVEWNEYRTCPFF